MADGAGHSPWWVVAAASVPSVASGLWVFWRWWLERGDKRHAEALAREQGLMRELEQQRIAMVREHADLFERLKAEMVRREARLKDLERHADRGWDLARWWNRRAHALRAAALDAQACAAALSARAGTPAPPWPELALPALEEPAERG